MAERIVDSYQVADDRGDVYDVDVYANIIRHRSLDGSVRKLAGSTRHVLRSTGSNLSVLGDGTIEGFNIATKLTRIGD